jgi:P pilus assembly chaperone PapD
MRCFVRLLGSLLLLVSNVSFASISVSPLIAEFTPETPVVDYSIQNIGNQTDYISISINRVSHPGTKLSFSERIFDPRKAGIMVTPSKLVLPANGSRTVRVQLTEAPGDTDKVYEITFTPTLGIKKKTGSSTDGIDASVDIVVAFSAVAIVRPLHPVSTVTAIRKNDTVTFTNKGNTVARITHLEQCPTQTDCKPLNSLTIFGNTDKKITLQNDAPLTYTVEYYPFREETFTLK